MRTCTGRGRHHRPAPGPGGAICVRRGFEPGARRCTGAVSISVKARVRAVPNFLACLHATRHLMDAQDANPAPARFKKLQAEVLKARALLSFAPASGRSARFLDAKSGWGQFQSEPAKELARQLGRPDLRELVLARHGVLYAHLERDVVLLSIRHERQLPNNCPGHPPGMELPPSSLGSQPTRGAQCLQNGRAALT